MADYKELLRRAVEALPENNGAARRAVYEKARAALVGQLRAINPPLAARDITTHRLQLEDCIRQVEQEASEANIAGLNNEPASLPPVFAGEARRAPPETPKLAGPAAKSAAPSMKPVVPAAKAAAPTARPAVPVAQKQLPKAAEPAQRPEPVAKGKNAPESGSIEDIIAAADRDREPVAAKTPELKARPQKSQPVLVARSEPEPRKSEIERPAARKPDGRQLPSIVARAEASKGRAASPGFAGQVDNSRRGPTLEPRREIGRTSLAAAARQVEPIAFDVPEELQAMAAIREVDVEQPADPQGAIDRAIATLDREARGDTRPAHYTESEVELDEDDQFEAPPERKSLFNGKANGQANGRANGQNRSSGTDLVVRSGDRNNAPQEREPREAREPREQREPRAPRPAKEFANPRRAQAARAFDGMPRAQAERGGMGAVTIFLIIFAALLAGAGGAGFWAWQEGYINIDQMFGKGTPVVTTAATQTPVTADSTGPGNTETPVADSGPATELKANERLPSVDVATTAPVQPLALQSPAGEAKTEERLGVSEATTAERAVAAIDPSTLAGSQSLLLEASDNGTTGAVPFSGTVDWAKGSDEMGQPTLVGKANIPARNLKVDVLIRKNSDPSLPASHLMEINFTVSDTFIGGSIAGLPGVLLKNEELVQGAPLVGASARVVGNSFLFALSAAAADATANKNLLTTRKWMDLALIYASGKRAIITLEKDPAAQTLFNEVFAAWGA